MPVKDIGRRSEFGKNQYDSRASQKRDSFAKFQRKPDAPESTDDTSDCQVTY